MSNHLSEQTHRARKINPCRRLGNVLRGAWFVLLFAGCLTGPRWSDAGTPDPTPDPTPDFDAAIPETDGGLSDASNEPGDAGYVPPEHPLPPAGITDFTMDVDGTERSYSVFAPVSSPSAILMILHGGGGQGSQIDRAETTPLWVFREIAEREDLVLVYPKGLSVSDAQARPGWNDCRSDNLQSSGADDVSFLNRLGEHVKTLYDIPTSRFFLVGTSNGAMMAFAMAKHRSELFAALSTTNGNFPALPKTGPCSASLAAKPALLVHGTADAVVPYTGGCVAGQLTPNSCPRGTVVSTAETVEMWRQANQSASDPVETVVDIQPDDAGRAIQHRYPGPTPLEVWSLEGAGHIAPSILVPVATTQAVGQQNRDVEFAELTWQFFENVIAGNTFPPADTQDAGPGDDASSTDMLERGVHADLSLTLFPQRFFDAYVPQNATRRAVLFLHGGAGNKEAIANAIGIGDLDLNTLDDEETLWLIPQGKSIPNGVPTWENHVMTSGANDVLFLSALARHAKENLGAEKVILAGHSNGGMMVHRMWCESNSPIDMFMSVAGPPASGYHPLTGNLSCSGNKPYWSIVGDQDRVLQTQGNLFASTWELRPFLVNQSPDAFIDTELVGERFAHRNIRAHNTCPDEMLRNPIEGERVTRWRDCDGKIRFWWVHAQEDYPAVGLGNHVIAALEEDGGFSLRALLVNSSL